MTTSAPGPAGAVRRSLPVRLGRTGVVMTSVVAAVLVNLVIHVGSSAAGVSFAFFSQGEPAVVDALTLIAFTAVPVAIGLSAAALLWGRWPWVRPVGIGTALVLGLGSIAVMPLGTDLDAASRVVLTLAHVVVTAAAVLALLAFRPARPSRPAQPSR